MRKFILAGALALAVCVSQASAQLQYDPYFVLPGKAKTMGADVGLANWDLSDIGNASDVFAMGKYSLNDKLEVGARATLGFLAGDFASNFRSLEVGGKYNLGGTCALAANFLVPTGDVNDPGLAVAYMHNTKIGGISTNGALQVNLLKGYAAKGVGIDLFLEPRKEISSKLTGSLRLLVGTNTDDIGNNLGVDLGPNVDIKINGMFVLNAGISLGLAGDAKQADPGLTLTLIHVCSM